MVYHERRRNERTASFAVGQFFQLLKEGISKIERLCCLNIPAGKLARVVLVDSNFVQKRDSLFGEVFVGSE